MAYTIKSELDSESSPGNDGDWPSYYFEDIIEVMNQPGFQGFTVARVRFRNEDITVLAGDNGSEGYLDKLALGCPPFYPRTYPAAIPGVLLLKEP